MRTSANEELGNLAEDNPLTGYKPNFIDNYQISETTEIFIQESSSDSRHSNLHDLEIDDYTIGRALSSPLFTQEREDLAGRRQPCHSLAESLLSSQSLSVGHVRTGRLVNEFGSLISRVREKPTQKMERQKEQTLADCRAEIQKHEFQADYVNRTPVFSLYTSTMHSAHWWLTVSHVDIGSRSRKRVPIVMHAPL